jgi:hypothetical protein
VVSVSVSVSEYRHQIKLVSVSVSKLPDTKISVSLSVARLGGTGAELTSHGEMFLSSHSGSHLMRAKYKANYSKFEFSYDYSVIFL